MGFPNVPDTVTSSTFTKAELIKALEMFNDDEPIFVVSRQNVCKCGVYQVNYAMNAEGKHRCELCVARYLNLENGKDGAKSEG